MRVMITGAAGRIGLELIEELADDVELCLVDRHRVPGRSTVVADLSRVRWRLTRPYRLRWIRGPRPRWERALAGVDTVFHLAADPSPSASWQQVARHNIAATGNLVAALPQHNVRKLVFASSHRVMLGHVRAAAPSCYRPEGPKIGSDQPPRPISAYGVSKVAGEMIGRMAVDAQQLQSCIAVRIGSFRPEPARHDDTRHTWVSPADLRTLFRRCLETEVTGFHVVYGMSGQPSSPYDLSHTRQLLSWTPLSSS